MTDSLTRHRPAIGRVATRLRRAVDDATPIAPVRDLIDDVDAAYAVQQLNVAGLVERGDRVVGRKIGLTSAAVQRQLGVDQPDFGTLLDSMQVPAGGSVSVDRLLQPRIEAEVAFVLSSDVSAPPSRPEDLAAHVATAHAAFEIVDSRIAGWDIGFLDTVADNASSGLFALGPAIDPDPDRLTALRMRMTHDDQEVSSGTGADCLGGPMIALHWLARTLAERGDPLRAGEIVLSGALGPMCDVRAGDRFRASFDDHHQLDISFHRGPGS